MQDTGENLQELDYVDISTDEDNKTIKISWKNVPIDLNGDVVNNFGDDGFVSSADNYPLDLSGKEGVGSRE